MGDQIGSKTATNVEMGTVLSGLVGVTAAPNEGQGEQVSKGPNEVEECGKSLRTKSRTGRGSSRLKENPRDM